MNNLKESFVSGLWLVVTLAALISNSGCAGGDLPSFLPSPSSGGSEAQPIDLAIPENVELPHSDPVIDDSEGTEIPDCVEPGDVTVETDEVTCLYRREGSGHIYHFLGCYDPEGQLSSYQPGDKVSTKTLKVKRHGPQST